jgi:hypothetical protein
VQFLIGVAAGADAATPPAAAGEQDVEATARDRRTDLELALAGTNDWLTRRARLGLLRCGLRGLGGEFGDDVASLCTADSSDFSCSFFWDTLFSSAALTQFDRNWHAGRSARCSCARWRATGRRPSASGTTACRSAWPSNRRRAPVATWALNRYLALNPDDAKLVDEMYPKLVANHRFWTDFSDTDRDGLAEYRWTGQVSDNSPLWDFYGLTDGKPAGASGCRRWRRSRSTASSTATRSS